MRQFSLASLWLDVTKFQSSGGERLQNSGYKDTCAQLLAHAFKGESGPFLSLSVLPIKGTQGGGS